MLGEYVGRIFEAVKERPLYVIASDIKRNEPQAAAESVAVQLASLSVQTSECPKPAKAGFILD